uniref:ADP-ribosylation factor like GTPase 5A n=1 Tax=Rattus norvegicus TaxID=10116 RepID=A0ABK0LKD2_RAT
RVARWPGLRPPRGSLEAGARPAREQRRRPRRVLLPRSLSPGGWRAPLPEDGNSLHPDLETVQSPGAQSYYCWAGQCREDYHPLPVFVIVVVDSTDRERISVTREELYKMLAHEDLRKAGLLIFANKQDVKECMTVAEISQFLKLTSIKDHQWHIQACCALTGEGLCQGLEWMMSRLKIR